MASVGGNSGTTLGEQRLIALQFAADLWGVELDSPLSIEIQAGFVVDGICGALAGAGPLAVHRDFLGAPVVNAWYPAALANKLAGIDLSSTHDITVAFNSNSCLVWYYGLDASPPSGAIDFVATALHELGHGLGFLSYVDTSTGAWGLDIPDIFSRNMIQPGVGPITSMTNAQRLTAMQAGEVFWDGGHVVAAHGGNAQMDPWLSHWHSLLKPEAMIPFYTGPNHEPGLALAALRELESPADD